jgi:hypothetical protein
MPTNTVPVPVSQGLSLRRLDDNSLYRRYDCAAAALRSATRPRQARAAQSEVRRIAAELARRKLPC